MIRLFRSDNFACFLIYFDRAIQDFHEVLKSSRWYDNGVTPAAHILGYAQKSAPGVFLEIKKELFPLDLYPIAHD